MEMCSGYRKITVNYNLAELNLLLLELLLEF